MLEGMRRALPCMLEAMEGGLCLLEVLETSEVPEVMRCVLFCMLEVLEMLDVLDVMRCVLLCLPEVLEVPEEAHCVLLRMVEVMRCVLLCLLEVF